MEHLKAVPGPLSFYYATLVRDDYRAGGYIDVFLLTSRDEWGFPRNIPSYVEVGKMLAMFGLRLSVDRVLDEAVKPAVERAIQIVDAMMAAGPSAELFSAIVSLGSMPRIWVPAASLTANWILFTYAPLFEDIKRALQSKVDDLIRGNRAWDENRRPLDRDGALFMMRCGFSFQDTMDELYRYGWQFPSIEVILMIWHEVNSGRTEEEIIQECLSPKPSILSRLSHSLLPKSLQRIGLKLAGRAS